MNSKLRGKIIGNNIRAAVTSILGSKIIKEFWGNKMKANIIKIIAMLFITLSISAANAKVKITYLHVDAQGSTVAATNEDGDIEWSQSYKPYGSRLDIGDTSETPKTYTGHVEDAESGLIYMQARYYNPTFGRFMATDPVRFKEENLHSFNRYAYANNSPYKYIDPDGRWVEDVVLGGPSLLIGAYTLGKNLFSGNWSEAAVDAGGIGVDIAACVTPGVPGGAAYIIKAERELAEMAFKEAAKRSFWKITKEGTERVVYHSKFKKIYKSKSDDLWWAADTAGHGGVKWKVFEETSTGLKWRADADIYGDFIKGKHKGPTGKFIPWKELSGVKF